MKTASASLFTLKKYVDKLQAICDKNSKKLQSLEIEWNSVRKPFEDALYLEECKKRQVSLYCLYFNAITEELNMHVTYII